MQARGAQLLTLTVGQHQLVMPSFQSDNSWGGSECCCPVGDVLAAADSPNGAIHFRVFVEMVGIRAKRFSVESD